MKKLIDYQLFLVTIALTFFGSYMILTATYYKNITSVSKNPLSTFLNSSKFIILGIIVMVIIIFIGHIVNKKISLMIMILSIALLFFTILQPDSAAINGAKRWIEIFDIQFTTSEVAKISSILFFGHVMSNINKSRNEYNRVWTIVMIFAGLSGLFIVLQPDTSTAFAYCMIIGSMLFISGAKFKHLALLIIIGALAFTIYTSRGGYTSERFDILHSDNTVLLGDSAQVNRSLMSIAEGGIFGVGARDAYQTKMAMPQADSDFIFASVVESTGLLGAVLLMSGYIFFIYRCIVIAMNAKDMYGTLVATGVATMIGTQAGIHILVATKTIPPTGMSLPFISTGGTSVIILLASVGFVLNISTHSKQLKKEFL